MKIRLLILGTLVLNLCASVLLSANAEDNSDSDLRRQLENLTHCFNVECMVRAASDSNIQKNYDLEIRQLKERIRILESR